MSLVYDTQEGMKEKITSHILKREPVPPMCNWIIESITLSMLHRVRERARSQTEIADLFHALMVLPLLLCDKRSNLFVDESGVKYCLADKLFVIRMDHNYVMIDHNRVTI